jgi:hypothetical protein
MTLNLKKESAFAKWYAKNKERLSDKRKKLYADEPQYRQRALEASRRRRRGELRVPVPNGLISFAEGAKSIGVGVSSLHDWRSKGLFPEPKHDNGSLWFSDKQVRLLKHLKSKVYGKRRWYMKVDRFKEVIAYTFANWE